METSMRSDHIGKTSRKHRVEFTRQDRAQEKSLNQQLKTFRKEQNLELKKFAVAKRDLERYYKDIQAAKAAKAAKAASGPPSVSLTDLSNAENSEQSPSTVDHTAINSCEKRRKKVQKRSQSLSGDIVRDELTKHGSTLVSEFGSATSFSGDNCSTDSLSSSCSFPVVSLPKSRPGMLRSYSLSTPRSSEKIIPELPFVAGNSPRTARINYLRRTTSYPPQVLPLNTPVTRGWAHTLSAALPPLAVSPGLPRRPQVKRGDNENQTMPDAANENQTMTDAANGKDTRNLHEYVVVESLRDCRYLRITKSFS